MNNVKFSIAVPGVFDEIEIHHPSPGNIRERLKNVFDDKNISIKFLKNNSDKTLSFTDQPQFSQGIAQFRVYQGSQFLSSAELIKWE